MIELIGVSKRFRTRVGWNAVLDDVSVVFPSGYSVGILGRNGAGKSTLLRLLGGAEMPDKGTIRRDVRVSWPIGFGGGLHGDLTGRENARFVARIYGLAVGATVDFAQEFANIGDYFDMPVKDYSTGMRARLAFGLSMAAEFECYLVDEVTAVGDQSFQQKCKDAFKERRGRSTVIMVSHSGKTIREYCDIAAVLHRGKLTVFDNIDEAVEAYEVGAGASSKPVAEPALVRR